MGTRVSLVKGVTEVSSSSLLWRWMGRVSADIDTTADSGAPLGLFRSLGGELQLSSPFGRWVQAVSEALPRHFLGLTTRRPLTLLRASNISTNSPLGKWMESVSVYFLT